MAIQPIDVGDYFFEIIADGIYDQLRATQHLQRSSRAHGLIGDSYAQYVVPFCMDVENVVFIVQCIIVICAPGVEFWVWIAQSLACDATGGHIIMDRDLFG
jgi:hypothetical protein